MNVSRMMLLAFSSSLCWAQMPSSFDASGQSAKADSGVQEQNGGNGEPANPQLFGMEISLLDPSTGTVKYKGAFFDVGNNAAGRARLEK